MLRMHCVTTVYFDCAPAYLSVSCLSSLTVAPLSLLCRYEEALGHVEAILCAQSEGEEEEEEEDVLLSEEASEQLHHVNGSEAMAGDAPDEQRGGMSL